MALRVRPRFVAPELPELQALEGFSCRICLSDTQSPENPLISPCHCDGTMKYIHLLCLREWLKSQVHMQNSGASVTYNWKPQTCELCKQEFPEAVVPPPVTVEGPHLILEEVRRGGQPSRAFHLVSFLTGQPAKIGRGHECDVRIPDISVSRFHAQLRLVHNEVYLEDRQSKFGTLLLCIAPVTLTAGLSVSLQIDRSLLSFRVRSNLSFCCCGRATSEDEEYENVEVEDEHSSAGDVVENDLHAEDLGA